MLPRTSPDLAARARALYAQGVPVKLIMQDTGLTHRQIYYWLDREAGAVGRPGQPAAIPAARRRRADLARPPGAVTRRRLMGRLWRAAEAQIGEIEARLGAARGGAEDAPEAPPVPRDAEREARALAVLARVLRELTALEAAARRDSLASPPVGTDGARDPDTFRRELARRLEHLRDTAQSPPEA